MEAKRFHFLSETRRVAFELWKAKVSLNNIMKQLQMSKSTLVCPPVPKSQHDEPRKVRSGGRLKINVMNSTLGVMKTQLHREPTLAAKQLKKLLPALENISVRTIQRICLVKLKLTSRMIEPKPSSHRL
jgi:hypothetical protein